MHREGASVQRILSYPGWYLAIGLAFARWWWMALLVFLATLRQALKE